MSDFALKCVRLAQYETGPNFSHQILALADRKWTEIWSGKSSGSFGANLTDFGGPIS